jgi:prepilin-type processing-associated H-X9-DG protein
MKNLLKSKAADYIIMSVVMFIAGLVIFCADTGLRGMALLTMFLALTLAGAAAVISDKENNMLVNLLATAVLLGPAFLFILCVFTPDSHSSMEKARRISCASNLKQIGLSLKQYAMDNDGHFPPCDGEKGLELLVKGEYLNDLKVYICPSSSTRSEWKTLVSDYEYVGGLKESDSAYTVICYDKCSNHRDFGNALYIDGHVKGYSGKDWLDRAKRREQY